MKISTNWLKEILPLDSTVEELANKLSVSGLEVEVIEKWESLKGGLENFVVGKVLTCVPHPNADRLKITTVDIGTDEAVQIVCGAANVAVEQLVIVAKEDAVIRIPQKEEFKITKSKIRGEISQGMICAEDEIGIGKGHDGILVLSDNYKVGLPASEVFDIAIDTILEIGLTANRGDAASHLGVARDLAALFNFPIVTEKNIHKSQFNNDLKITVEDSFLCNRYIGVRIDNVVVSESPNSIKNKLKAIGIEPRNNVVDLTNFILHHYGQPVHAFDADKIAFPIQVRKAKLGESLKLLDGKEIKLNESDLVIADKVGPIALAGIMGGYDSSIQEQTKNVFLEIAHFDETSVRKSAKRHTLNTDASFRFERGVDVNNLEQVAIDLSNKVCELTGGQLVSVLDVFNEKKPIKTIEFDLNHLNRFSGYQYQSKEVSNILKLLGFELEERDKDTWKVLVPSWRNDVSIQADLFEEVMRIYGYDQIPFTGRMQISLDSFDGMNRRQSENKVRNYLVDSGFFEVVNSSLTSKSKLLNEVQAVELSNPLSSDMAVMRQSLLPSLLDNIAYNQNRQSVGVKLYEMGNVYFKQESGEFGENTMLGMVIWGNNTTESWEVKTKSITYFDLKSTVVNLINRIDSKLKIDEVQIQEVTKPMLKDYGITGQVFFVEIPLKKLLKAKRKEIKYSEPSKFFNVRRDLSLVVNKSATFKSLEEIISKTKMPFLVEYKLFDLFEGKPLLEDQKSMSIAFFFNKVESTLRDEEIDKIISQLIQKFEDAGVSIRK